ncbi:MAG: FAD-binding oxidoreductase [Burkholderiales bacterium]|jgi:D-arginine dehydrogenase|nr:FAD-binding oxidoreductase [Burkholderiales bacterium]
MTAVSADILVVGAGIAGASAAHFLAQHGRVVVLERESQPGYHTTGRSAALYSETYGNAAVRAITTASRDFFHAPPPGFAEHPLVTPRGAIRFAPDRHRDALHAAFEAQRALVASVAWLDAQDVAALLPMLRPGFADWGIFEPDAQDMDVNAIHTGFLRGARARGMQLFCDAEVTAVEHAGGRWHVTTPIGRFEAPVLVNAAGAWCDALARLAGVQPVGLQPKRRTAFTFPAPDGVDIGRWPMGADFDESFYVKPEAGLLLASPANEDDAPPHDVQPEDLDVAIAVDRIETQTTLPVRRIARRWAGLRSFVADRTLVAGFDPDAPGFFWLAGQGGYGIQTAPAMGEIVASLVVHDTLPAHVAALGTTRETLAPSRLRA